MQNIRVCTNMSNESNQMLEQLSFALHCNATIATSCLKATSISGSYDSTIAVASAATPALQTGQNERSQTPGSALDRCAETATPLLVLMSAIPTLLAVLLLCVWWRMCGAGRRRLPGPRGLPLLGCLRLYFSSFSSTCEKFLCLSPPPFLRPYITRIFILLEE